MWYINIHHTNTSLITPVKERMFVRSFFFIGKTNEQEQTLSTTSSDGLYPQDGIGGVAAYEIATSGITLLAFDIVSIFRRRIDVVCHHDLAGILLYTRNLHGADAGCSFVLFHRENERTNKRVGL